MEMRDGDEGWGAFMLSERGGRSVAISSSSYWLISCLNRLLLYKLYIKKEENLVFVPWTDEKY